MRRTIYGTIADILQVIHSGESKPTVIMNMCNIDWSRLKGHLSICIKNGWIHEEEYIAKGKGKKVRKKYVITSEGKNAYAILRNAAKLMGEESGIISTRDSSSIHVKRRVILNGR